MSDIKCTVNDCHFHGSGNICKANAIEVSRNFGGGTDIEAGAMGGKVNSSNQTKCVTYRPAK